EGHRPPAGETASGPGRLTGEVKMSAAFFIVLDQEDPGFDTTVNGKNLSQNSNRLERIAKGLGIRPLEDYISYSPDEARAMMEDLGADSETINATELPQEQWYDPQEGLDLVARLTDHVRANPTTVRNTKGVLADLQEYKELFEQAKGI